MGFVVPTLFSRGLSAENAQKYLCTSKEWKPFTAALDLTQPIIQLVDLEKWNHMSKLNLPSSMDFSVVQASACLQRSNSMGTKQLCLGPQCHFNELENILF